MPWSRLEYQPGIVKDRTRYSATGYWYDGSLVRFRSGLPESWGGWINPYPDFTYNGVCRALVQFSDLSNFTWLGIGTNSSYYMLSNNDIHYEVTPVEEEETLGTDPITTTLGSSLVNVEDTDHLKFVGQTVILAGATAVGGLTTTVLNDQYTIVAVVDDDNYTIDVGTNATSTATGGGSSVTAKYLFYAGSVGQIYGGGWGALGWGDEEWGGDPALAKGDHIGLWSHDSWGEDLVACAKGGPIFYWDATNPDERMVDLLDLSGADGNAPSYAQFIVVSHRDRHLLAFGAEEYSTGIEASMSFRWCSQEDVTNWNEADTTGTAGSLPLSRGSRFVSAISTKREIVAWTDQAIYSINYIGAPYVFNADMIDSGSDILGLNSCCAHNGVVFWIGRSGFYAYDGQVTKLACPVWDYVLTRINFEQGERAFASTNSLFGEILFFYPSTEGSGEVDSYVSFSPAENAWSIGELSRTAWLDGGQFSNPHAAGNDGCLYLHEYGAADGSVDPAVKLNSYIEAAPFELSSEGSFDKGDRMMFIRRIMPDITFRKFWDGVNIPKVNFVLKMMDKPGGGFDQTTSSPVSRPVIVPVEEFTTEAHVRLRGRSLSLRIETARAGTLWRLGVPRIDSRTDGQR